MIFLYIGALIVVFGIITYKPPKGSWPGDKIPPPAPAVACTIILTCVYFLVYAGIQIGKTVQSLTNINSSKLTGALQGAILTMFFAPMLAILFIAARMRALQMDPLNGHPQWWAQNCFYACTYALLVQCILAIVIPLVVGGEVKKRKRTRTVRNAQGELEKVEYDDQTGDVQYEVQHETIGKILEVLRWIVMACIYVGFSCVIYSVFTIQHPKGPEYTPPISVTMQCVINLTVQFFFVYLLIWIAVTVEELMGWDWHFIKNPMETAVGTVAFCPMLAILFVGVRMRALRLSNNRGAPQGYVQDGMYCATWAVLLQFAMVVAVPICTGRSARMDDSGSVKWRPQHPIGLFIVTAVKWLGLALMYGGVLAVIVGIYTMTPQNTDGSGELPLVRQTPFGKSPPGLNDAEGLIRAR